MSLVFDNELYLAIANLTFKISCQELPICQLFEKNYQSFVSCRQQKDDSDTVTVRLLLGEMPGHDSLKKVFDAAETWSIYNDGDKKLLVMHGSHISEPPMWKATIDINNRRVDVYCGPKLIGEDGSGRRVLNNPLNYPLDQILLMFFLENNGVIIHAAGVVRQGKGAIFAGPSRAGKSTISLLLNEAEQFTLLSDDRIVICKSGEEFLMYGTPWPGEAGIASNSRAPLQSLFFLEKGSNNNIRELPVQESIKKLLPVVSLPWYDETLLAKHLDICGSLLERIRSYVLTFTPDPESAHELLKMLAD